MSYAGTVVPIPLGVDGGYGLKRIPITGLLVFRNLTLENNQWEKEGGATSQNATPLSDDILAMFDWWSDAATQRFLAVTADGGVYRDTGAWTFATTVISPGTLTTNTRPPHLVAAGRETPGNNRKLFLFTGNDEVRIGSGDFTTMSVIDPAKKAADWTGTKQPTCGCVHQGRLWAALGDTIYYSTLTDHENFAGGGSIPIAPGDGLGIFALASFRKMLIVFKDRSIYIVDTSDPTVSNWRYDPQSLSVGVRSPYAVTQIPNDLLFVDADLHVNLLSATDVVRDASSSDLTTPKLGTWVRDNLDATRSHWVHALWYGDKHQGHIGCSALGATTNNRRLVVDFNNPAVEARFTYSDRDVAQALALRLVNGVGRPFLGDDTGTVYQLDQSTRSKDGVGYTAQAQTDHTDLGEVIPQFAGKRKAFDYIEFEYLSTGEYNLSINIYIDGVLKTTTPLTISLSGAGVPLGTFLIGTDRLGFGSTLRKRRRLKWTGTRISVEVFNSNAAETFQLPRMFLGARLAE